MTRSFVLLFFCVISLVLGFGPAQASNLPKPEKVQIALYPSVNSVTPGQPFTLVIEQVIEPGWHTYWLNPGDSGTPTTAQFGLPLGGVAGPLQFPTPYRIPYGPLLNFGYAERALFSTTITPPATLDSEMYTINVDLGWLVCNDICLPEGDRYSLVLPVGAGAGANEAANDVIRDLTLTHPVPVTWPATFREEGSDLVLDLQVGGQAAQLIASGAKVEFFPEEWGLMKNAAEQKTTAGADGQVTVHMARDTRPLSQVNATRAVVVVTDDAGTRLGFALNAARLGAPVAPQSGDILAGPDLQGQAVDLTPGINPTPKTGVTGFIVALGLAFLGGLILNLMPCVFPVLSLKVLSLAQLKRDEVAAARRHGLAYAAGVIVTFLVVASVLIIVQQFGSAVGWGFQLQEPMVVAILTYLFVAIGLNLMGWFEIDIGRWIPDRWSGHQGAGLSGSFLTGGLATLVATPCTAPFMGTAVAYALTQHPALALLVFAALGLGLALPFVVLCYTPRLRRILPRPGRWMLSLRQFLAFPMFLAAIWLVWVIAQQTGPDGAALALLGGLSLAMLIWLAQHPVQKPVGKILRAAMMALAFLALVAATMAQHHSLLGATPTPSAEREISYTPAKLEEVLATNQPVFVYMTAAWCITCKVNERLALAPQETQDLFTARNVAVVKGDWTNYNPEITAYLDRFQRKGVPLYVFYPKPDDTGVRPKPVVLAQLLTPGTVRETISSFAP